MFNFKAISHPTGNVIVLTGAGISAESGIPTFRGPEGYWTVGSHVYQPQELATWSMFQRNPEAIWAWYLYRHAVCNRAEPNKGHLALVDLERHFQDRFLLITQNVDGLHRRAGTSDDRLYEIHGNIRYMRCSKQCGAPLTSIPDELSDKARGEPLTSDEAAHLHCIQCGAWTRPHVLWFDEYYDEEHFRFHSSLERAAACSLLIIVGTSGATNLPMQIAITATRAGATLIDINPDENPFSELALQTKNGQHLAGNSSELLPLLVEKLAREVN